MKYYISRGVLVKWLDEGSIAINRCGREYILSQSEAAAWTAGTAAPCEGMTAASDKLAEMGLAAVTECEDYVLAAYRLLTNCTIVPDGCGVILFGKNERRIWKWLTNAGLRLTMAELCYLMEHDTTPEARLLGKDNRQALVETIYTADNIEDGLLETEMERARRMPDAVSAILHLLKAGRISLI